MKKRIQYTRVTDGLVECKIGAGTRYNGIVICRKMRKGTMSPTSLSRHTLKFPVFTRGDEKL